MSPDDVVYARVWSFADWWAASVRVALRTMTGDELRDRLFLLLELAAGERL